MTWTYPFRYCWALAPLSKPDEGTIVKRTLSAILFSLASCGIAQATAIDLDNHQAAAPVQTAQAESQALTSASDLPEPEVLAMMVVGLILIGYKVSRHSSEKFK
jgi:hypothetical protein